jgi:hypothetical protein
LGKWQAITLFAKSFLEILKQIQDKKRITLLSFLHLKKAVSKKTLRLATLRENTLPTSKVKETINPNFKNVIPYI